MGSLAKIPHLGPWAGYQVPAVLHRVVPGLPVRQVVCPVPAVRQLLAKLGWAVTSVDLFEINEAFAVQALAVTRELGLDPARVNVNGGAVALGHPIGASGARILVTLVHALRERGLERGVASLCMGGGNGLAIAVSILG